MSAELRNINVDPEDAHHGTSREGGTAFALVLLVATVALIAVGTIWPNQSDSGVAEPNARVIISASSAQDAVNDLLQQIARREWHSAYQLLGNKGEFSEPEFKSDLTGEYGNLRSYAMLNQFDLQPLRASADQADIRAHLIWSSVVGTFEDSRDLHVVRNGRHWEVNWPIVKEARVPPQVIAVNYLRWDVIYRGPEDDWGAQDVEAPHVRIVAMHPMDRAGEVILMGEILNEDVVPAFVTVKATLIDKTGNALGTEDAFDKISHVLLPKQVSPFRIDFHNIRMSQVDNIRMQPSSNLVPASADPVIGIESQKLNPVPDASLTGQLVNQSGQVVNVAHVIGTFYDGGGQIVWVADQYPSRALLPGTPVPFQISLPADISNKIKTYRVVATTYISSRIQ
ncbi:MAG: hypothetical protein WBV46_04140 [Terriglobales bacterium]|jgi:hypothetical protein